MKKYVALALALMLAFTCLTGCGSSKEDTVMNVNGSEVSWDEYMYWLGAAASELSSYYANYSDGAIDWDGTCMFDKSITNAEWCVKRAKETVAEIHTIDNKAKELGVTVSDEDMAAMDEQIENVKTTYCTGDDPDAELKSFLEESFLTLDSYKTIMTMNLRYSNLYTELYGDNAEKLESEKVLEYAEENGFVTSAHILFSTVDDEGEPLSEKAIAAKKEQAEKTAAELQAITDETQRSERFFELMNELSEDPGKESFPKGYCFTTGSMVEVYDTTSRELEPYAVSDPVESDYGFHVIMRIPTTADDTALTPNGSAPLRSIAAPDFYAKDVEGWTAGVEAKSAGSYGKTDFTQFFTDEGFKFVSFEQYTAGGEA